MGFAFREGGLIVSNVLVELGVFAGTLSVTPGLAVGGPNQPRRWAIHVPQGLKPAKGDAERGLQHVLGVHLRKAQPTRNGVDQTAVALDQLIPRARGSVEAGADQLSVVTRQTVIPSVPPTRSRALYSRASGRKNCVIGTYSRRNTLNTFIPSAARNRAESLARYFAPFSMTCLALPPSPHVGKWPHHANRRPKHRHFDRASAILNTRAPGAAPPDSWPETPGKRRSGASRTGRVRSRRMTRAEPMPS